MSDAASERYARYRAALGGRPLPALLVDLDALERNVATARRAVEGTAVRVRVGSKSVRCVALIKRIAEALGPAYGGVLGLHAREARHLVAAGLRDVLVAYPTAHPADLDALADCAAQGATVTAMVDCAAHVAALSRVAAARGVTVPVAIDVDMSWRGIGLVLGVRRSPVWTAEAALALAETARAAPGIVVRGYMGYEAQVAGLPDRDARGRRVLAHALLKSLSRPAVRARRAAVAKSLRDNGFDLVIANGGGTGSLRFTAGDPSVNEVVVGSGFLGSHLFDGLDEFRAEPAACFALPVSRRPAPDIVTCLGGGWIASGPPSPDRLPRPWLPEGLSLLALEGAGEVQTPLRGKASRALEVGDPVFFRHAKAGEPMERVDRALLLRGDRVEDEVPTYRGDGLALV